MTALPVAACPTEAELEFDRQVDALVMAGLPEALDLADECFRAVAGAAARPAARRRAGRHRPSRSSWWCPHLPVVPVLEAVHTVGGSGFTTMDDDDLARFRPLPELRGAGRPVPAGRRRPGRRHPEPAARRGAAPAAGRRPLPAHDRRGARRPGLRPGRAARPELLLAAGLAGRGQAGPRAVGQRPPAAAGLVLPGRAAHLARLGLLRRPARRARRCADRRGRPGVGCPDVHVPE